MHRYETPSGSGLVAMTIVAVIAAGVSFAAAAVSATVGKCEATSRLDVHRESIQRLTAAVNELRSRVLQIERPNQPVYPPRNPGRIGGSPVIPWIEPWSGSRPSIGTEIGPGLPSIGSGGNAPLIGSPTTSH